MFSILGTKLMCCSLVLNEKRLAKLKTADFALFASNVSWFGVAAFELLPAFHGVHPSLIALC